MKIVVTLAHRPTADQPDQPGLAELMSLLTSYGIAGADSRLARSADEAAGAAAALGFPVAIKIVSPDIPHEAEVGGVVLDLRDAAAVRRATGAMFGRIASTRPAAVIHGVLVQSMAPVGWELFLAGGRDGDEGPVVSVGGTFDGPMGCFARLLVDRPELIVIEINPRIVGPDGSVAVNAQARRDHGERPWN
jgi:acyl-CoA synthetase (NDP forming)